MTRVLTARFMHETNTFSRVTTDMAMIRRRDYHLENEIPEAFRGTRSAFGATFEAADKVLRVVPHADLKVLDPHTNTATITLMHGHMIYDTRFRGIRSSGRSRRWSRATKFPRTGSFTPSPCGPGSNSMTASRSRRAM